MQDLLNWPIVAACLDLDTGAEGGGGGRWGTDKIGGGEEQEEEGQEDEGQEGEVKDASRRRRNRMKKKQQEERWKEGAGGIGGDVGGVGAWAGDWRRNQKEEDEEGRGRRGGKIPRRTSRRGFLWSIWKASSDCGWCLEAITVDEPCCVALDCCPLSPWIMSRMVSAPCLRWLIEATNVVRISGTVRTFTLVICCN